MIYKLASDAYYYAIGMCQWNYGPLDVFLLQVTMNYTVHLMYGDFTDKDKAVIILKKTINDALQHLDNHDPTNKPLVESLLENLKKNLLRFQAIVDEKTLAQLLEIDVYFSEIEYFEEERTETLSGDSDLRVPD